MRSRFTPFIVASFVAVGCGTSDEPAEDTAPAAAAEAPAMSDDEAAIDAVRTAYVEHFNMGHPDVVAGLFSDSAFGLWANGEISQGKEAVQAYLATSVEDGPRLGIETGDMVVTGDNALTRGTWTTSATPEGGEAINVAGNFMTVFGREGAEWKIVGVLTNFNAPPPADMPTGEGPADPPPDDGTMGALIGQWMEHFNSGNAAGVAALYAPDAHFSIANTPAVSGRAAIESLLAERIAAGGSSIEIHDVGTMEMGDGLAVDGGWYTMSAPGEGGGTATQSGAYMLLLRQQADGTWQIQWHVSNGQTTM